MRAQHLIGGCIAALTVAALGAAGRVELIDAVKSSDAPSIHRLLQQGVDVNAAEIDGSTALHWAVNRDDVDTVKLLLDRGANVKAANRYGARPLDLACINGNAGIIEMLLKAGADPNSGSATGQTALMTAARTGKVDAVQVLLARGADVNAKETFRGQTALMWAAGQGHADTVRALIEAGADIHVRSKGNPDLTRASARPDDVDTGGGSDKPRAPAAKDPPGLTPLLFAVRAGHIAASRVLLDAGANVNETVGDGSSALLLAVMNAHYELAALLLDKGANPNADAQGWTPLHQLVFTRRPNTNRGAPVPLPSGNLSDLKLVEVLVKHGADANARMKRERDDGSRNVLNSIGATPYLLAAKAADVAMMRALVANGADPLLTTDEGATPLMAAAGVGIWRTGENPGTNEEAVEAAKLALELGGDVDARDANGDTAIHGALYRGSKEVVQFLAEHGANLDSVNAYGWTPLTIAEGVWYPNTYKSERDLIPVLRQLGARNLGTRRAIDLPPSQIDAPVEGVDSRTGAPARILPRSPSAPSSPPAK